MKRVVAIIIASIVAPLVNSLLYRVGLVTFFREYFFGKANDKGLSPIAYFVVAFTSASFFLEVGLSAIFSPIIVRICNIMQKEYELKGNKESVLRISKLQDAAEKLLQKSKTLH